MKKAAVIIFLPEDTGFKAEMNSVSGSVKGSFAMEREGEDEYVYGDGRCEIDVNPVIHCTPDRASIGQGCNV